MKTKHDLSLLIMKNASEEARELLEHAEAVADFIIKNFPDGIPDRFMNSQCKSTETAFLGGFRHPAETGRLMLDACMSILHHEKENKS